MLRSKIGSLLASAVLLGAASAAQAGVTFNITESGGNLLISGSGSLNLTGASYYFSGAQSGYLNGSAGLAVGGPTTIVDAFIFTGPGAGSFGTGGFQNGSSDSGDVFGLTADDFYSVYFVTVYDGYVSGSALSGSTTIAGGSFASFGLNQGTYVYTLPNDTVTVNIGSVPEPATWAMLLTGFFGVGGAMRVRRRGVAFA